MQKSKKEWLLTLTIVTEMNELDHTKKIRGCSLALKIANQITFILIIPWMKSFGIMKNTEQKYHTLAQHTWTSIYYPEHEMAPYNQIDSYLMKEDVGRIEAFFCAFSHP